MTFGVLEGTGFEVIDKRFSKVFVGSQRVERLWTGGRWCEGPAWFAAGRYLVWSDIPNNRMMRWDETDGSVSVFRQPSGNSNGNTVDREGRLVSCEHSGRRVSRTNFDGTVIALADRFEGKRFNSPNDAVVDASGAVWFTDPAYGIDTNYEGDQSEPEIEGCHVYRVDPGSGKVTRVADDFVRPNGIAFSPDGRELFVVDTGRTHKENGPAHMRRFRVEGEKLSGGEVFADCTAGLFDGFRFDTDGRVWTSADDGVHCYDPDGTLIGKIRIPETVANVTFGGPKKNRLFICGTSSLYSVFVMATGAARG